MLNFQKSIVNNRTTLPIAGAVALILWFVLPPEQPTVFSNRADYGLWRIVPTFLQEGYWSLGISAVCAALAVYLMAELNNTNVLLRVSSRMHASTLAFLLGIVVPFHQCQIPGCVSMVFMLLSLFPLYATYQMPSPMHTLFAYIMASMASLTCPKLLWLVPLYWLIQIYFRAFSLRCLVASLLGTTLPYWFYGGIAVMTDTTAEFLNHIKSVVEFDWYDYTTLDYRNVVVFAFIVLLFLSGTVDFYINQYLDKTRVRIIYKAMIMYGIVTTIIIAVFPQYFWTFLPLLLVCSTLLFSHFFTLTHTKFSNIYCIILLCLAVVVVAVQCLCDSHLNLTFL